MATTVWGAGLHGGLLNSLQYLLQQSLNCDSVDPLYLGLAAGTGVAVGAAGGTYTPISRTFGQPLRPLANDVTRTAMNQREAARELLNYHYWLNFQLTFFSTLRGAMGSTVTNYSPPPPQNNP